MGDVVKLPTSNITVPEALEIAAEGDLTEVVILGSTKEGDLYLVSSLKYRPDVLWMLESIKTAILEPETD